MATLLGIFNDRSHAEMALSELTGMGYSAKDVSVIMKEDTVSTKDGSSGVVEGAASGATTGTVLGGLAGLLIGIGAIAIPGVGGLLIGGPLAAALGLTGAAATTVSGAVTGAVAGGLVGGLVNLGLPEEEARVYETRIKEGAVLLAVPVKEGMDEDKVRATFEDHQADQIRTV